MARTRNGRVGDADIGIRRTIFIDIDPVRPKEISATGEEKLAAYEVYTQVAEFLFDVLKDETVLGRGDSGNGFFILIAIEPTPVAAESNERICRFLKLLANLFDTKRHSSVWTS
jgi:hypothetical protein